jgi:hypothetical protein
MVNRYPRTIGRALPTRSSGLKTELLKTKKTKGMFDFEKHTRDLEYDQEKQAPHLSDRFLSRLG